MPFSHLCLSNALLILLATTNQHRAFVFFSIYLLRENIHWKTITRKFTIISCLIRFQFRHRNGFPRYISHNWFSIIFFISLFRLASPISRSMNACKRNTVLFDRAYTDTLNFSVFVFRRRASQLSRLSVDFLFAF